MADKVKDFVDWLVNSAAGDRAALAALRRGLGQPPGYVPEMLPYMARHVSGMPEWQERLAYIVAPLFAVHPSNTGEGNMGDHMAALRGANDEALERRFAVLLAAHPEELDVHLRHVISMLKQNNIPVNWEQLMRDIGDWGHPDRQARVRRRWANSFWRSEVTSPIEESGEDENESSN